MKATEIIRSVLDLIDHIEIENEPTSVDMTPQVDPCLDDDRRFNQIVDLLHADYQQMYNNSPLEVVAGINSVTKDAGGGWNGPKNPADMRADSVSMFPAYQAEKR